MRGTNRCGVESSFASFSLCNGEVRHPCLSCKNVFPACSVEKQVLEWELQHLSLSYCYRAWIPLLFENILMSFQSTYFLFFSLEIGMYVSASGHYSENKFCNDAILLLKCGWSISFVWSNISLPPKKEPYQLHFCSITVVQEHFVLQSLNHPYTTMPLSCLEVMQGKPFKTRVKESSSTVV